MARVCQVCGGLVPAFNEVLGYSGPICNGAHGNTYNGNSELFARILELEKKVAELTNAAPPKQELNKEVNDNDT